MALGVPVLVSDRSETVAGHVKRSGGGLLFRETVSQNDSPLDYILSVFRAETDYNSPEPEFAEALQKLLSDPDAAKHLGVAGKNYIEENYSLPVIRKKLLTLLRPY